MLAEISIRVNPAITPTQLYDFYLRNTICEANYSQDRAAEVLKHPSLVVAALERDTLVGFVRALTDGLSAAIMEFSLDLRFQGPATRHKNGSLVEADESGLGARLGRTLLDELASRQIDFITSCIVEDCEEPFYESLGFKRNVGHQVYYIDKRPYAV